MTTVHNNDDSDYDEEDADPNGSIGARPKDVDRFGFTGGNQFTQEGEIAIPVSILRKREMKWLDMLDDWDKWMTKKPKKVRERCRKGIPSSIRSRAWKRLCGGQQLMEKNRLRFQELDEMPGDPKWVDTINKDLDRQFPFHEMFAEKGGSGQQDLFRILKAYSLYNPRDGYCQAMAPVAAVLLMHMPAEEGFWCFAQICDKYLTGYYSPGLEAVQVDGEVLHSLLKKVSPATYKHMKKHGIDPILYMTEWFMCIFSRTLPWSSVLRIWDIFLFEGIKVLFRLALVILKCCLGSPESLKKYCGLYEALQILKNVPQQYLGEEFLVEEMLKIHVFEKDLESEHSLTVARRKAMRTRQLSKESATDMLKKIEDLKKKKKKVRPPKPTDDDDTKSIISYAGFGSQESPQKQQKRKKKEKTKKAKDRDPGVAIYRSNIRPAWSDPEPLDREDQLSQTSEFSDYTKVGTTRSEKMDYDYGVSLGVDKQTSRSEGALTMAAQYKLAREPSIDSSIHEEGMMDDKSLREGGPPWVDSSPSKSSSAIPDDSSSSASSQYVELGEEAGGMGTAEDADLVTFVRSHPKRSQEASGGLTADYAVGGEGYYSMQLPGAVDYGGGEQFEGTFERNIQNLSFDGNSPVSPPHDRTSSEDPLGIPLGATALNTVHHSASVDSGLRPEGSVQVDYNSSDTLRMDDSETTLHSSGNVSEVLDAAAENNNGHTPVHVPLEGELPAAMRSGERRSESQHESYIVETNPDFSEEYEMHEPAVNNLGPSNLPEELRVDGNRSPCIEVESGGKVMLQFDVGGSHVGDHIGSVGNVNIDIENSHSVNRTPETNLKIVENVFDLSDLPETLVDYHIDDVQSDQTIHTYVDDSIQNTHEGEVRGGIDFHIDEVGAVVSPSEIWEEGGENQEGENVVEEDKSVMAIAPENPSSSDEGTSVDPIINVNVIVPGETKVEGSQSDPIAVRVSPLSPEEEKNTAPFVDQSDHVPESIDTLPLSETDSSSISDGRANGGSLNGASNGDSWLLDDLNELQVSFSGILDSDAHQGRKTIDATEPTLGVDPRSQIPVAIESKELEAGSDERNTGEVVKKDEEEKTNKYSHKNNRVDSPGQIPENNEPKPLVGSEEGKSGGVPPNYDERQTVIGYSNESSSKGPTEHLMVTNGGPRVADRGGQSSKFVITTSKPPVPRPATKPRKPDPLPRPSDVHSTAQGRGHRDAMMGTTGGHSAPKPPASPKPRSGKKPVPLPKKKGLDKRVVRGPITKSTITDKL